MGSTTLRLGIDLDGVVADFNAGWISRYNRDFGASLHTDQVVEWDAPVHLTHFATMDGFWDWARTCAEGRSLFHGLEPYDGAVEALHSFAADGHHIVLITTKPEFAIRDTHDWLARHRISFAELHILDDKTEVACDVYLDDADHNLAALTAHHPTATVCRYVRPWNNPAPGSIDVADWTGFAGVVTRLARR